MALPHDLNFSQVSHLPINNTILNVKVLTYEFCWGSGECEYSIFINRYILKSHFTR